MTSDNDRNDDSMQYHDKWPDEHAGDEHAAASRRPRATPPKEGMGTGMKILLVVCCVAGGGFLLCCGACAFFGYSFQPTIAEAPADVEKAKSEIIEMEIPASFQPGQAMKFDNFMFSMKFANYEHKEHKGQLTLAHFRVKIGDPNAQELQMREQLRQQGHASRNLLNAKTEQKEFQIRGEKVPVTFMAGKDAVDGKDYRQVTGMLPGKQGPVLLVLEVEADAYDEEAVTKMLESIK